MKLASLLFGLLGIALAARAQSTFASLTGSVVDSTGAAVPKASIEARNRGTGYVYQATTNSEGIYVLNNLLDGKYTIKALASGFGDYSLEQLTLTVRENRRLDITMQVQTVTESVEVSGGVALIETESARIADTKDRDQMRALPLTLRRAWDYVTLSPQVNRTSTGFNLSFSGSRSNQSEANIDGMTVTPPGGGFAFGPVMDRTENLQEMRVELAANSAEFATPGGLTLTTRAGNNAFHGTLSDYYSAPLLRARNPFAQARGAGISHRLTFGAGGPLTIPKLYSGRNRTFYFATLEMGMGSPSTSFVTQTAPLVPWRSGNFSNLREANGALTVVRDPNGNTPFANNVIPASRLSSVATRLQERFYALPNFGPADTLIAQNYRENRLLGFTKQPQLTVRLDHRFSDRDFVYGRFIGVYWNIPLFETMPTVTEPLKRTRNLRSWLVSYTRTISASMVNEVRWGLSSDHLPVESTIRGRQVAQELGLQGLAPDVPDTGGMPRISFVGIGISALGTNDTCNPCFRDRVTQLTDNFTWNRGRHLIKAGLDIRYGFTDDFRQAAALFGSATFTNRYSGFPYADFLLGTPNQVSRNFNTVPFERQIRNYAGYVQDQWKATSRLTVNAGVRYQIYRIPRDRNGRAALFDVSSGRIVIPDGSASLVSPLLPRGYVEVVEASKAGFSNSLLDVDTNNFAPRFGFAYRPGGNTVIRGGAGIYYDNAPADPVLGATVPFLIAEPAYVNTATDPLTFPRIFPAAGAGGPSTIAIPRGSRRDIRIPLTGQYTLTLEHQRWDTGFRLTYTGTNTRQGIWRRDFNQPAVDDRPYSAKPRPFPNYPGITYGDNGSGHQYHGLSMEVERRMKRGFAYQAYFTWARDIGDLEHNETPENAYDRRRERAAWGALPTTRFSGNTIYELPFGKGRKWMNSAGRVADGIFGGWLLSAIYNLERGNFLTPSWTGADPTGTRFAGAGQRAIVTLRPDILRDPNLENPTVNRWFDVEAFTAPQLGRFGTSAKGVLIGTPINVMHATISKNFIYRERLRVKLEGLATNLLNHPNWAEPNTSITAGVQSGAVTATINRNTKFDSAVTREFQLQLRVEW